MDAIPPRATKNLDSPLGGLLLFSGLAGVGAIKLRYPHQEVSFKRTRQLFIPASVDVV